MALINSLYRNVISCVMLIIFPSALFGGDFSPAAMLYAHGETVLNGVSVPRTSALFTGDLIQTRADSVANISAGGSTVLILNDSLIEYDGNALKLEHGGVTVSTSKSISIRAGAINVSPRANGLTEFEVRDVDGAVHIAARKGDLAITDNKGSSTTLAQGQETTQQEADTHKESKRGRVAPGAPPASDAVLNSPVAIGIGVGVIAGLMTWALVQSDNPASPTAP